MRALADAWPADPFHPNLQLRVFLKSLATHPDLTHDHVRIMRALKGNTLIKRYAPTVGTLRPPSIPLHYVRLMEGVEKSQLGIGRPMWKRLLNIW
ncbi:hypothetical protein EXIGLDRAFT_603241 [Exidia glandulosa HHB12029]|uniref:Uncharacterized protein n=1 Tax=Exidia glandulosa HHB12029 TaxID=1314781 RepID=A0A166BHP3_EXIGL|nr:hypothetical protein EXIGLDRAFT_603241 [Exidia glandulosa HHB12029]